MLNSIMPAPRATPNGYERARQLRHEMTPAENKLWAYLRGNKVNGLSFRRQHAIGPYIVDFCAIKAKIIIELDGSQHLEQEGYDAERTKYLEAQGYTVLRFWNNDVLNNLDGVMSAIIHALEDVRGKKQ
jgi:very-short-patch-repair endonuclease